MRILIIMTALLFTSAAKNKEIKKDAKNFGKESIKGGLEKMQTFNPQEIKSNEVKKQTFDPQKLKQQFNQIVTTEEEILKEQQKTKRANFKYLDEEEAFIKESEQLTKNPQHLSFSEQEEIEETEIKKCTETSDQFQIELVRELQVIVREEPKLTKKVKVCAGHTEIKKIFWREDAKEEVAKKKNKFSSDPSIEWHKVKFDGDGKYYLIKSKWKHKDDAKSCNRCRYEEKTVEKEKWIEEDQWVITDKETQEKADSSFCTLDEVKCLRTGNQTISGKEISRPCWVEKLTYKCIQPVKKNCDFLKKQKCELLEKKCLQQTPLGCSLWELSFRCRKGIRKRLKENKEFLDESREDWDTSYEPNTSFGEATTKLKIFNEMKKDMDHSKTKDISKIELFEGKEKKCSKSVADKLLYDCCFAFKGLAEQAGLTHCTVEEKELAQDRDLGKCHYVGSKEEKFIGLWKSRTEHIFCCFPSKLARVFQEEARKQIGIGWGTPEKPNCRGLTQKEILKVNFSELDVEEAFEEISDERKYESKLENFQTKMEQKFKKEKL